MNKFILYLLWCVILSLQYLLLLVEIYTKNLNPVWILAGSLCYIVGLILPYSLDENKKDINIYGDKN